MAATLRKDEKNMEHKHVYLTAKNAKQTIDDALSIIIADERQSARSEAFEDCTNYWKKEIQCIVYLGAPATTQLSKIKSLFGIEMGDNHGNDTR
jgi:hypothetical protein